MIEIEDISVILGSQKVHNKNFEKKLGFKKNQIINKTGIKYRYISNKEETAESLAISAVKKLLFKKSVKDISHIISVTNTPSFLFPSVSHFVHAKLKMQDEIQCIGINAGCTGFVDALYLAYKLIKNNKKILIVTTDTYTKFINKNDRSIVPLFSDGASAVMIKFSKKGMVLKKSIFSTTKNTTLDLCGSWNKKNKQEIIMNGANVLSFVISDVLPNIKKLIKNKNKSAIVCHQAGKIVFSEIKKNVKNNILIPQNYSNYGNLVSTSIPNLLYRKKDILKRKKNILFSGFGVGLSQSHLLFSR